MRDELDRRARSIVDTAVSEGPGDFVKQVASELPLQAIADLIGVPQDDRDKLFKWSNEMMGYDDPEYQVIRQSRPPRSSDTRTKWQTHVVPARQTTSSPHWSRPTSTATP